MKHCASPGSSDHWNDRQTNTSRKRDTVVSNHSNKSSNLKTQSKKIFKNSAHQLFEGKSSNRWVTVSSGDHNQIKTLSKHQRRHASLCLRITDTETDRKWQRRRKRVKCMRKKWRTGESWRKWHDRCLPPLLLLFSPSEIESPVVGCKWPTRGTWRFARVDSAKEETRLENRNQRAHFSFDLSGGVQ